MRLKNLLEDERGTLESGLTLIPLTLLFLLTSQLIFLAQWGNWQRATHQDLSNTIAISGAERTGFSSSDLVRHEPLIGGGYLVVSRRTLPVPLIANFSWLTPGTSSEEPGRSDSLPRFVDVVSSLSEVHTE